MNELIATLKEGASEAEVTVLDQISLALAKYEADLASKSQELASKVEELASVTSKLAELEAEKMKICADFDVKYQELQGKIDKARSEAYQIAAVKAELAEFAEGMSEEDLLNRDKVEIARLKKALASKEKVVASADAKPVIEIASAKVAVTVDKDTEFKKNVNRYAFGE